MSIEIAKKAFHDACAIIGEKYAKEAAEVEVLAIGGQESGYTARRQLIKKNGKLVPEGPAAGFWQFEKGDAKSRAGVTGVMMHHATETLAKRLCNSRGVVFDATCIWEALQRDDVLAAGFARLLLLTDPGKLPAPGEQAAGWKLYEKVWRPGKPHPETWQRHYVNALQAVGV